MTKLIFVMDDLATIKPTKDSTFALMLAAQARGMAIFAVYPHDLFLADGRVQANARCISVTDTTVHCFSEDYVELMDVADCDAVFMRCDPPFDFHYLTLTYLLDLVEAAGTPVINHPQAIRDANEKLFTTWFPDYCPPTLVTSSKIRLQDFLQQQGTIICKPLNAMGGQGIFKVHVDDPNQQVIFETVTANESVFTLAQSYLPAVINGDRRLLLIAGELFPRALVRIPQGHDHRANMAAGGRTEVAPLTPWEQALAEHIGPTLSEMGLNFVGLDVIGDRMTEINVTSPTGLRELARYTEIDVADWVLERLLASA